MVGLGHLACLTVISAHSNPDSPIKLSHSLHSSTASPHILTEAQLLIWCIAFSIGHAFRVRDHLTLSRPTKPLTPFFFPYLSTESATSHSFFGFSRAS